MTQHIAVGDTVRHAASGHAVRIIEVIGPRDTVPAFMYRGWMDKGSTPHEATFQPNELVAACDPLAIATEALYDASEAARSTRSELEAVFMSIAEDALDGNGHHRKPATMDLRARLVHELEQDPNNQNLAATFGDWIDAERAHKAASEAFLRVASMSKREG